MTVKGEPPYGSPSAQASCHPVASLASLFLRATFSLRHRRTTIYAYYLPAFSGGWQAYLLFNVLRHLFGFSYFGQECFKFSLIEQFCCIAYSGGLRAGRGIKIA